MTGKKIDTSRWLEVAVTILSMIVIITISHTVTRATSQQNIKDIARVEKEWKESFVRLDDGKVDKELYALQMEQISQSLQTISQKTP